jgi:uncharacterized protein YndB with AHSA1/START domain/DNA-binding transcriptional ArsR family regulator
VELVFKALGHPDRRRLLDLLFVRDGRTLGELCEAFALSRYGVMKHLRILESAGLVVTRRSGREKFHYLNPIPIRLVHDRWITKYAEPWVGAMGDLKARLEGHVMSSPKHVYEVYIRTTPDKLWKAITDPSFTKRYFYGTSVESDWKPGSSVIHRGEDGKVNLEGKVLTVEPGRKLVTTFRSVHDPEAGKDRPSRVTWEITALGEVCKLSLTHDDFDGETKTYQIVGSGWNPVLSGLKTLLETGSPLAIPMPATR